MTTQAVIFKNNLPTFTRLIIQSQDMQVLQQSLRQKLKQAPMMFIGMQLVVDLGEVETAEALTLDLSALRKFLVAEGINPLAVLCNKDSSKEKAIAANWGVMPLINAVERPKSKTTKPTTTVSQAKTEKTVANEKPQTNPIKKDSEEPKKTFDEPTPQASTAAGNQVIQHSVRSGQRIYAKGDLTIVGAVSPGAEVIADGNVHVYGTLRGRAIAGAQGDEKCRIFCQKLDAELIAIAGNYKQLEEISDEYRNKSVQISLDNEKIRFFTL